MDKQKILFILDHLKGGGAERIALELCTELQQRGADLKIILLDDSDIKMQIPSSLAIDSVRVSPKFMSGKLWRNRDKKFTPAEQVQLKQKVEAYQPDKIVLSHSYAHCIHPIFSDFSNVFFWVHFDFFRPEFQKTLNPFRLYRECRRWYLDCKYFKRILNGKNLILVNDDLQRRYQPFVPNARLSVLPNGVDVKKVLAQAAEAPVQKQWDCIFVGRLSEEKQPEHALSAFAKSGLTGRIAVVGDGHLKDKLTTLCQKLGIAERVDFLGWQTNPYPFIKQSKCLVLSSNTEGSPMVVAEALLLDVPVVAYNLNSGIRQQLNHNHLKRGLVESQNIDALTSTLADVVQNPYPIAAEDKERLSMHKMAEKFLSIINA